MHEVNLDITEHGIGVAVLRGEKGEKGDIAEIDYSKVVDGLKKHIPKPIKGERGLRGLRGVRGLRGIQGKDGKNGIDGKTLVKEVTVVKNEKLSVQQILDMLEDEGIPVHFIDGLAEYIKEIAGQLQTWGGVPSGGGNIANQGGGGTWGSITGTLSSQTDLQNALNAKQATLVSGTNIKTINGTSLLGSGDITISGGGIGGSITAGQMAYGDTTANTIKGTANATLDSSGNAFFAGNVGVKNSIQFYNQYNAQWGSMFTVYGGGANSLTLHGTTDVNMALNSGSEVYDGLGSGVAFASINDPATANLPIQFRSGGGMDFTDYGGGMFSVSTNNLHINRTNGYIGIFNGSPTYALDVSSTPSTSTETVEDTSYTVSNPPIIIYSVYGTYYDNTEVSNDTYYDGGDGFLYSNYDNHIVASINYTTGFITSVAYANETIVDITYQYSSIIARFAGETLIQKATVSAIKFSSGASSGYVLTSDAYGNASWQAASGGSQTPWTSNINGAPTRRDTTMYNINRISIFPEFLI